VHDTTMSAAIPMLPYQTVVENGFIVLSFTSGQAPCDLIFRVPIIISPDYLLAILGGNAM
jgi:hypothetical protein